MKMMNNPSTIAKTTLFTSLLALALLVVAPQAALANHSVLCEGEQDWDGDGLTGAAEDANDGVIDVDPAGVFVFGTITGALSGNPGSISHNGRITIVTSGKFLEQVNITPGGNVILEAAPGVSAAIEAFAPPGTDPANLTRQGQPGIIVDEPDGDTVIVLRNLTVRNWSVGILIRNQAKVTVENCVLDSNSKYGIEAIDNARVTIVDTTVSGTGYRVTPAASDPGNIGPGIGIVFKDTAFGAIFNTTVSNGLGACLSNQTGNNLAMRTNDISASGCDPLFDGVSPARFDRPTMTP